MKTALKLAALFAIALAAGALTACHAQLPPTTHSVSLTWTAPTSPACNTASPCTYVISRATGTTCPAVNLITPNYTPLNSSSPVSALSYTDTAAAGLTVCYIAQTLQGGAVSQPSNTAGPFVVPASPGAPSTPNGTVADMVQPALPEPSADAPAVVAKLEGHVK
jgi:hypothetical protein